MARMDLGRVSRVAIDETAARRGHDYITLVVDIDGRRVTFVGEFEVGTGTVDRARGGLFLGIVGGRGNSGFDSVDLTHVRDVDGDGRG